MAEKENGNGAKAADSILAVAARLFADRGYDATSMREVAEGAGVAKPTVYYHFGSKEGLFDAILESGASFLCESLAEINARCSDEDARKCLQDAVSAAFEFARVHGNLNRFIHSLIFSPPMRPERQAVDAAFERVTVEMHRILRRVVDRGLMDASRLPAAATALRGSIMAHIIDFLKGRVELTSEVAAGIVDGFLNGYGKRNSEHACGDST